MPTPLLILKKLKLQENFRTDLNQTPALNPPGLLIERD